MKGYVEVPRQDLLSAIIGFGVRYDMAKETLKKGVDLFYDKYYTNGSRWTKWRHRNKTPKEFTRWHIPPFGTWDEVLWKVLDKHESDEILWWCNARENDDREVRALYNANSETAMIDNKMAKFVNYYKDYLDNCK